MLLKFSPVLYISWTKSWYRKLKIWPSGEHSIFEELLLHRLLQLRVLESIWVVPICLIMFQLLTIQISRSAVSRILCTLHVIPMPGWYQLHNFLYSISSNSLKFPTFPYNQLSTLRLSIHYKRISCLPQVLLQSSVMFLQVSMHHIVINWVLFYISLRPPWIGCYECKMPFTTFMSSSKILGKVSV